MRLRRFIACFLAASLISANCAPHAQASTGDAVYEVVVAPFNDFVVRMYEDCSRVIQAGSDIFFDSIRGAYEFWSGLIYDAKLDYANYLSTLDSTTASSGYSVTGFTANSTYATSCADGLEDAYSWAIMNGDFVSGLEMIQNLGIRDKVAVLHISDDYFLGIYWDSDGRLCSGRFVNPFGKYSMDYFGVYSFDDLELVAYGYEKAASGSDNSYLGYIFYSKDYALASAFVDCHAYVFDLTSSSKINAHSFCIAYWKSASNRYFSSDITYAYWKPTAVKTDGYSSVGFYGNVAMELVFDNSRIIIQPSGTDSSSRGDDLMEMISDYNKTYDYLNDDSVVNYYIGTINADGSVDKFFEPGVFDEDTMIFTEPESGTEYQASSWEYDYTTRTYGIAFEDGVLSIDGQAANIVLYTLGDDACVLSYYNGETLVKQVSYNYLMVSQSVCNINGHTNTVEATKEATCTAPGERLTTCSVCGHQMVEELPQLEHTYSDYTVQKEATCTNDGMAANTCLTCGAEVTELLPALGHDWLPTSITDESWAMPADVHCPSCSGTVYSYDRSDYEVLLGGKNYFDLSKVVFRDYSPNIYYTGYVSEVGTDSFVLSPSSECLEVYPNSTVVAADSFNTLGEIAPFLKVGLTYTLSGSTTSTDSTGFRIYFSNTQIPTTERTWYNGESIVITEEFLNSKIKFYGSRFAVDGIVDCRISNIQIELGTEATAYEPYNENQVELIPPIYNFTCQDCFTEWTAEAIYQHAYTTFTCSRCDETMIQSEDPDAGLFGSIGNFFADGISWITDKLSQFIDSLSGINDAFQDYMEDIKGSGGQFPAFLAAFVAVLPEDLMVALWFCLIAVVALLVWKKWFS